MLGKTASLEVRAAEGVTFRVPIASPFTRCLALALDFAVVLVLSLILQQALGILVVIFSGVPGLGTMIEDMGSGASILLQFFVFTFYGMLLEWAWRGQTVGKRLMKLRVIDERGLPLDLKQIVIRNLFRTIDMMPSMFYLLGGIFCVLTKRCQRIGDIAAGTLVVREVEVAAPSLHSAITLETNSFASMPHLEGRLRQNTTPDEARVALDAVTRRDEMTPENRLRVFSRIASYFRAIAEFPDEITHNLSDEQYVRNVVDTLFRRASR